MGIFDGVSTVDSLLASLSFEEKVAQISCGGRVYEMDCFHGERIDEAAFLDRFPHGTGQLGRPSLGREPEATRAVTGQIQNLLRKKTSSGIPALFNEEGVHGLMGGQATVFPSALALAATWDEALVESVYTAVAKEARARGSNYVYAPVLDLARDPRWGRVEETFGEDPFLVGAMGVAAVFGLQGRRHEIAPDRVLACAKHFVGHGVPQGGINAAPVQVGYRELRTDHAAPFEAVIRKGDVGAIMVAYHDWDGVPTHVNHELLVDLLREELGFEGLVTSDGFGIPQLESIHRVAADPADAARQALAAGVDCEVPEPVATQHLRGEEESPDTIDAIDRACGRVLEAKERLGLLDDAAVSGDIAVDRQRHAELSQMVAEKAVVLLTNDEDTLPIDRHAVHVVAVSGPNAHPAHLGGYTDPAAVGVSVLDGIRQTFAGSKVIFGEGCRITEEPADASTWWQDDVELADPNLDDDRIAAAVKSAEQADLAVVVVGGNEATHREGWWFDHLGDRSELTLAGRQEELVERVASTGTTTVAVVISAGPVDLRRIAEVSDAVLWAGYPGERGGHAIARVIAGEAEPGGRLPITFPRSTGQIPAHGGRRPSAGRGYLHSLSEPLFSFGHGGSYTFFQLGEPALSHSEIACAALREGEKLMVDVSVTNTGERRGSELVRVLVTDDMSSVARPRKRLAGFQRVELGAGESASVRLALGHDSLRLLDQDMEWVVEPGDFIVDVVTTTESAAPLTFRVVGD